MKLNQLIPSLKSGLPDCAVCSGTGILLDEMVQGSRTPQLAVCVCVKENCYICPSNGKPPFLVYDENADKMVPCYCHESRKGLALIQENIRRSNIPPRYQYKFLHQMDTSSPGLLSLMVAHDWANELVQDFKNPSKILQGMYLSGGTGSGKTLLACSILNHLIFAYGVNCKYAKVSKDFLNAIKGSYNKENESYGQESIIENEIAKAEVLVLDDFGVQKETDWANSKLYDLIDYRYENEKLTLLTSNHPLEDLKEMGEGRIYSRLLEMTKEIKLDCPDYREKLHHVR